MDIVQLFWNEGLIDTDIYEQLDHTFKSSAKVIQTFFSRDSSLSHFIGSVFSSWLEVGHMWIRIWWRLFAFVFRQSDRNSVFECKKRPKIFNIEYWKFKIREKYFVFRGPWNPKMWPVPSKWRTDLTELNLHNNSDSQSLPKTTFCLILFITNVSSLN